MICNYNFNCAWDYRKKERISHLLSERVLLLVGICIHRKISNITFCERECIAKKALERNCIQFEDKFTILCITGTSNTKTYELVMDKEILFSMLLPGVGQSHFDNLILTLKNVVQ